MRRLIVLFTFASLLGGSPWSSGDTRAETPSDTEGSEADRDDRSGEKSAQSRDDANRNAGDTSAANSARSNSILESPRPYTVGIGINPGVLFWDTPFGGRETSFTVMATGHARISRPLIGSISVGYARRAPSAGSLVVANDHVTALAGFGAEGWLETLRFSAQAQGGVLSRRLTITDGTGATYRSARFAPAAGGRLSVGASFDDRVLISLVSGFRFFPPNRTEYYTGIEAGWLLLHAR